MGLTGRKLDKSHGFLVLNWPQQGTLGLYNIQDDAWCPQRWTSNWGVRQARCYIVSCSRRFNQERCKQKPWDPVWYTSTGPFLACASLWHETEWAAISFALSGQPRRGEQTRPPSDSRDWLTNRCLTKMPQARLLGSVLGWSSRGFQDEMISEWWVLWRCGAALRTPFEHSSIPRHWLVLASGNIILISTISNPQANHR